MIARKNSRRMLALAAAVAMTAAACGSDAPDAEPVADEPVATEAMDEAMEEEAMEEGGPFTIFAPVNDAFAAIPEDDLAAVLADQEVLTSILTLHVVGGQSLEAAGLASAGLLETVNGETIEFGADGTTVNGVDVLCSDVTVANGTVHIIGEVLMPSV